MWAKPKPSSPANVRRSGRISPLRTRAWSDAGDLPLLLGRRQVGDGAPPEHLADHGRALQHRALERLEPVEPRGEDGLDGLGHADRLARRSAPAGARRARRARRPRRACAASPRGRAGCRRLRGRRHRRRPGRAGRRDSRAAASHRRAAAAPAGSSAFPAHAGRTLGEVAASEAADEDRRVAGPAREVLDQVEKRRLRPLDVVEDEQHRPLTRERLEEPPERPVELVAARVWLGATDGFEETAVHRLAVGLARPGSASRSSRRTISTSGQ